MALQRAKLTDIQYLPASAGSLYANPVTTKSYIRGFVLHNSSGAAATAKLHNVPDAAGALGTAGAGNAFFDVTLDARETVLLELPYSLVLTDENDAIFGSSDTATAVTVQVLGDKE